MTDNMCVLVTGSDGFIGRHLVPYLTERGFRVIAASRLAAASGSFDAVTLPDLAKPFDWKPLIENCDAIVHLAGIAHTHAPEELYVNVNHLATGALANAAVQLGKHLVFI